MCIHKDNKSIERDKEPIPGLPFSEYYETIVETYSSQIKKTYANKSFLKFLFFFFVVTIMGVLLFVFVKCLMFSYDLFAGLIVVSSDLSTTGIERADTEIMAAVIGSSTALVSSCVSVILAIFKLPEIMAKYLFSEKEDDTMCTLINNIQNYTLNGYVGSTLGSLSDPAKDMPITEYDLKFDDCPSVEIENSDQGTFFEEAAIE